MYLVKDLYEKHQHYLKLELVAGKIGINKKIRVPEAQRPGLSLSGYLEHHADKCILVFGKVEIEYLQHLKATVRVKRLEAILNTSIPAVFVARNYSPPKELEFLCEKYQIPLFRSHLATMDFLSKLMMLLMDEFAPSLTYHGTLVEIFGIGVLLQGESSIGKSEAALGLIERGHRLITDDVVRIKKKIEDYLEGTGAISMQHHLEIRGLGILNIANLYGVASICKRKKIDIVVSLEKWQENYFYDRVGLEEKFITILEISVPHVILPVNPNRDIVLLLETIALNYQLKQMGYHSAQEFIHKVVKRVRARK